MKLILADLSVSLIEAWTATFEGVDDVAIHHGSIFDVDCDALVSPANSYGFMDGGLDLAISEYFGWHVQERLQQLIRTKHHGELLVGLSEIVATDHPKIPYVIAAPTMRIPMALGNASVNPYLAMRAILLLVKNGLFENNSPISDTVKRIAIPGLGTGVGQVRPTVCANQMFQAINDIMYENYQFPNSWYTAAQRQYQLCW